MKNVMIITLGTRDVTIEKSEMNISPEQSKGFFDEHGYAHARTVGKWLLDNYDERIQKKVNIPIVLPALNLLKSRRCLPEKIILIATDQNAALVGEKFYSKDSVNYAKVLEKYIPFLFKSWNVGSVPIVITCRVEKDVNFLDRMYAHFQSALKAKAFKECQEADNIFLLNQGGIDAINNGLLLAGIAKWKARLKPLAVDEKSKRCYDLDFVNQMIKTSDAKAAEDSIARYDYAPLLNLDIPPNAITAAQYALSRLHFDFESAHHRLNELRKVGLSDFFSLQSAELDSINIEDGEGPLRELYVNARIKYWQQAYVDFLVRFFRIAEEFAKKETIRKLNLKSFDNQRWRDDISKILKENAALAQHVAADPKLEYWKPTRFTFSYILKLFAATDAHTRQILSICENLEPLASLRNNSIGAHAFDPVSVELIDLELSKRELRLPDIFTELDSCFDFDFDSHSNPFNRINETLLQLIEQNR